MAIMLHCIISVQYLCISNIISNITLRKFKIFKYYFYYPSQIKCFYASLDSNVEVGTGKKGMSQLTLLKWLLTSSSHLGRALAELFGLLVYQCVGSQNQRLRRHNPNMNQLSPPTPPARNIAALLTKLLMEGLSWKCPDDIKVPRLR